MTYNTLTAVAAAARKFFSDGLAERGVVIAPAASGSDDYAALQALFTASSGAGEGGQQVVLRKGIYKTSQALRLSSHLVCEPGTLIQATAAMSAVISVGGTSGDTGGGSDTGRVNNVQIDGLAIDCNDFATDGLWLKKFSKITVSNVEARNFIGKGFRTGNSGVAGSGGYEALFNNITALRDKGTIQAGSIGFFTDTDVSDTMISGNNIIRDAETGVSINTGNNDISGIHCWALPAYGVMRDCFYSTGGNRFLRCQADTPSRYGWNLAGTGDSFLDTVVFNNNTTGSDNIVIGIHCAQASPGLRIAGMRFVGATSGNRLARDCDGSSFSSSQVFAVEKANVTTKSLPAFSANDQNGNAITFAATGDTLSFSRAGTVYLGATNAAGRIQMQAGGKDIFFTQSDGFLEAYYGYRPGYNGTRGGGQVMSGTGSPEGVVAAPAGSIWLRTNGGAATTFYVKETGAGNTGWVAK